MSERDIEAALPAPDKRVRQALEDATKLVDIDGIEGVGEGATPDGEPCVVVMISSRTPEVERRIPRRIKGVPTRIVETGPFRAGG